MPNHELREANDMLSQLNELKIVEQSTSGLLKQSTPITRNGKRVK